jgi:hypothetical protein
LQVIGGFGRDRRALEGALFVDLWKTGTRAWRAVQFHCEDSAGIPAGRYDFLPKSKD